MARAGIEYGTVLTVTVVGITGVTATEAIRLLGTELGTLDHARTAIFGDDRIVINADDGTDCTRLSGTTTGDSHVEGMETVAGIATTAVTGMEPMALSGTELGTAV